uniref:RRM domain-containing protein n=1 Tax=Tetradesmus obliquus TaxID=3088 RepID=A0A383WMD7_TETOB
MVYDSWSKSRCGRVWDGHLLVKHNVWQLYIVVYDSWSNIARDSWSNMVYDSWGKSRGFGTVRFSSKEDADAACTKLNNTEYEGRTITVRLDRFA